VRSGGLPCGAWLRWGAVGHFFTMSFIGVGMTSYTCWYPNSGRAPFLGMARVVASPPLALSVIHTESLVEGLCLIAIGVREVCEEFHWLRGRRKSVEQG